eukprot:COSAG02_NODE_3726_length_6315_cov_24.233591_2_plen_414_part_00
MANAWRDVFAKERQPGGLLHGVSHINFWSDNGPPYHSGEWLLELLGIADDYNGKFHEGITYTINFNTPGEGKSHCDAHFSRVSQCKRQWTDKFLQKLTAESLPEFMTGEFGVEECCDFTKVLELPIDHVSTCPTDGEFFKIKDVKQYLQFFVKDNVAWGRKYSDIGTGQRVRLVKDTRQAGNSKRSGDVDKLREAMLFAVKFLADDVGLDPVWQTAAERNNARASTGFGLTACARFVCASSAQSPFRKANWLCYNAVLRTMKDWTEHTRFDLDGVRWKPGKTATPHSIAKKLGAMELCRLGAVQNPPLPSCGSKLEPLPEHYALWTRLQGTCSAAPRCSASDEETDVDCNDRPVAAASDCDACAETVDDGDASSSDSTADGSCPEARLPEDAGELDALDDANDDPDALGDDDL